jgi:predicted HAD superfamily Cof-like phosphohydrolase
MINDVLEFHQKFGLPLGDRDELTASLSAIAFRLKFLQEELNELQVALLAGDRVKAFDALLDLVYVAHGTALWLGIDPAQWEAGERHVQRCNLTKERAPNAFASKRGSAYDVIKPAGFVGPEAQLAVILTWPKGEQS